MTQEPTKIADYPMHVGIIMDGNGRWAHARHRPRLFGHQEGVKTVRRIVEDAGDLGIKYLTLYSFSTENWTRPEQEIKGLFTLLKKYVDSDLMSLHEKKVRVKIIGSRVGLDEDILAIIDRVERTTRYNTNFYLNIAFNYGGRDEIIRAVKKAVSDLGDIDAVNEANLAHYLDTSDMPDPDLIIRTSGEERVSNFLMWQAAYAEFVFTDVLWPDFTKEDLISALDVFKCRDRRFGNFDHVKYA